MNTVNNIRLPVEIWAEILSNECLHCEYWAVIRFVCKDWTAAFRLLEKKAGGLFIYENNVTDYHLRTVYILEITIDYDKTLWHSECIYGKEENTTSFTINKKDPYRNHSISWTGYIDGRVKNNVSEILKHVKKCYTEEIEIKIGDLLCAVTCTGELYYISRDDNHLLCSDDPDDPDDPDDHIICLDEARNVAPYIATVYHECINYFFTDTLHVPAIIIQCSRDYDKFVLKESSVEP